MSINPRSPVQAAREGYVSLEGVELYYRELGSGQPVIVVHGGPDFDHCYLLPDLDRLSGAFRLVYYDQRGRGRSATSVRPEDISMQSEVADLDALRKHLNLESVAVLGHSWGGLLAMEYALRHPERVSHLILMNCAPASRDDYLQFREARRKNAPEDVEMLKALSSGAEYAQGDIEADAAYYRVHFLATVRNPEQLERVVQSLRRNLTMDGIVRAREIEGRLMEETWLASNYDLVPRLKELTIPTVVIHGDYDFVPVECAAHIAEAIPGARFVLLKECGHFSYIERPDEVYAAVASLFGDS